MSIIADAINKTRAVTQQSEQAAQQAQVQAQQALAARQPRPPQLPADEGLASALLEEDRMKFIPSFPQR